MLTRKRKLHKNNSQNRPALIAKKFKALKSSDFRAYAMLLQHSHERNDQTNAPARTVIDGQQLRRGPPALSPLHRSLRSNPWRHAQRGLNPHPCPAGASGILLLRRGGRHYSASSTLRGTTRESASASSSSAFSSSPLYSIRSYSGFSSRKVSSSQISSKSIPWFLCSI